MRGDFTRSTWKPGKHYSGVRLQQGRVQLDADWNEQVDIDAHLRETGVADVVGQSGAPRQGGGFLVAPSGDGKDLTLTAGRLYVDGLLCELDAPASYLKQPDLPNPPAPAAGVHFVYLDVWRHHVTALEDPEIRESALGGPDTATRTRTVCQVKLLKVAEVADAAKIHCLSDPAAWQQKLAPSAARMRARAQAAAIPTDPCTVPADAGYTRLENQLYRVEIHDGGVLGKATFKWSRENGSVVTGWTGQNGNDLTVESPGRDRVLGFTEGNQIELTDDGRELRNEPGVLVAVTKVEGSVVTINPGGQTILHANFPGHPRMRRWEGAPRLVEAPATNDGWLELENGIQVRFEGTNFQTGDYWLIPARAFIGEQSGSIEWPRDGANPAALAPDGIEHHVCKLAVAVFDGGAFKNVFDCRPQFPALTELMHCFPAGGDGQQAPPGRELPCSLAVGVTNGRWPVEGARVLFEVGAGQGSLMAPASQNALSSVVVSTSADGIAECRWQLPRRFQGDDTACLQVTARLVDVAGQAVGTPVFFHARFLLAEAQQEGIHVKSVLSLTDGNPIENDALVEPKRMARGLRISCDAPLSPEPFERMESTFPDLVPSRPVCFVTVHLPYPLPGEGNFWDFPVFGFQTIQLAATLQVRETEILWTPTDTAVRWLESVALQRLRDRQVVDRLLIRLTLKGNAIWHRDRRDVFLDGNAFGRAEGRRVGLTLPSGDGQRGGDFETWFWLALPAQPQPGLVIEASGLRNIIAGTVKDAAGAAVPGLAVTLTGPNNVTQTAQTTAEGSFRFAGLAAGNYTLRAQSGNAVGTTQVALGIVNPLPAPPTPVRPESAPEPEKEKGKGPKGPKGRKGR
jgi:hypothetical protein